MELAVEGKRQGPAARFVRWSAQLKKRPLIAAALVLMATIGGLTSLHQNLSHWWTTVVDLVAGCSDCPRYEAVSALEEGLYRVRLDRVPAGAGATFETEDGLLVTMKSAQALEGLVLGSQAAPATDTALHLTPLSEDRLAAWLSASLHWPAVDAVALARELKADDRPPALKSAIGARIAQRLADHDLESCGDIASIRDLLGLVDAADLKGHAKPLPGQLDLLAVLYDCGSESE